MGPAEPADAPINEAHYEEDPQLQFARQLSAGDPGEVRSRRLHRTCAA